MKDTSTLILNEHKISQKLERIAHQILENHFNTKELILVGVENRGSELAQRLAQMMEKIGGIKVSVHTLHIDKDKPSVATTNCNLEKEDLRDKSVLLVDDVLNSGRTLMYAAAYLLEAPLARLTTCVLVDRRHRLFPIRADFVGLTLSTTLQEHISVHLEKGEEAVYLD